MFMKDLEFIFRVSSTYLLRVHNGTKYIKLGQGPLFTINDSACTIAIHQEP